MHQIDMMIKKRHFSFLKCLFFCLWVSSAQASEYCLSAEQQLENVAEWGITAKIIDGDTIHLQDRRKVRFIGINTPEIGRKGKASQPFAKQAYRALVKLLKNNKKVGLSYDQDKKDRYKRLLAYVVLVDGQSVEQALLAQGLAYSIVIPPNAKHIDCYRAIEEEARKSRLGVWQLPENQWIEAHKLSSKSKGYRFVSGMVSAYSESKKSIYLKLTPKLSIRIAKKDLPYFSTIDFKSLQGKKLRVRGWVSRYKGRQSIHVRTAYDIEYDEI